MRDLFLPEATPTAAFAFVGSPLPFVLFLALINVVTFFVYGDDKRRAKRPGARRIPEKTLLLLALFGGSLGALAGMRVFHHKTRHWYFRYGVPAILFLQLALLGGAWWCWGK